MVVMGFGGPGLARLVPAPPWDAAASNIRNLDLADLRHLAVLSTGGDLDDPAVEHDSGPEAQARLRRTIQEYGLAVETSTPAPAPRPRPPVDSTAGARSPVPGTPLRLRLPLVFGLEGGCYAAYDHGGNLALLLDPVEVAAAAAFCAPLTIADATVEQRERLGDSALDDVAFARLARRLIDAGVLAEHDPAMSPTNARETDLRRAFRADADLRRRANEAHAAHDAAMAERRDGQRPKVRVVPVQVAGNIPPLSTGMVFASVRDAADGSLGEVFDLHPRWITQVQDAPAPGNEPTVYLFTNYIWSHERNLDFAAQIKANDPRALTIHGGPDCPTYPRDAEEYLRRNPQVDIAVRGEGEATAIELFAALAPSIAGADGPDLSALAGVAGLPYRYGDRIVRTADRDRIEDIDSIPSPYLTGVFDLFGDTRQMSMAIIETNRGCPYGCTFCNWGSATNSRIRKFDLDRVMAEFEWCAQHEVPRIFIADANFGIFSRDVDIARHVVALKERYGYPHRFITNYAKNTVKHLKQIVGILAEGGVLSEGLLSLQSMDDATLTAIRRSNIKLEKYEALAKEFHQSEMPLFVDLMMGLPGQTYESLRDDLQQCIDREVNAKCHATELLVNSPMNDPAYRSEHGLVISREPGPTGKGTAAASRLGPALVVSSTTFSREDYRRMDLMRRSYLLAENFGVMRQVLRFVRRETGQGEVEVIEAMRDAVVAEPSRWPHLEAVLLAISNTMVPPVSWAFYIDDLRRYLVDVVGLPHDSALDTVLTVQHALLPAPDRAFPYTVALDHDYAAWYQGILAAKDDGHLHDWATVVDRLHDHGPATMTIDDPHQLCQRNLGAGSAIDAYQDWELSSPVARAMPQHYQAS